MADQSSRGGQKAGNLDPAHADQHRGTTTGGAGERSDQDKQQDQRSNPDDAARTPTDQQR
jgi:hypothetical protein